MLQRYCHTRLHLGFSVKQRIWQVPACKMEPRSGNIFWKNRPPTRPPTHPTIWIFLNRYFVRCPHPNCSRALCGVPTLVWTSDQITSIGMCGVPPPHATLTSWTSYFFCAVPPHKCSAFVILDSILESSWMINLAQLVSPSVALPAELVRIFFQKYLVS